MADNLSPNRLYWTGSDSAGANVRGFVEWARRGDRFAHCLGIESEDGSVTLLESCEGRADDPWPSSPPVQQTSSQTIDGRAVWLALGMAGRSHWSMSFEPQENGLIVDVAARLNGTPLFLGSTYRVSNGACRATADGVVVACADQLAELTLRGDKRTAVELCESDAHGMTVTARPTSQDATARWGLRLGFL